MNNINVVVATALLLVGSPANAVETFQVDQVGVSRKSGELRVSGTITCDPSQYGTIYISAVVTQVVEGIPSTEATELAPHDCTAAIQSWVANSVRETPHIRPGRYPADVTATVEAGDRTQLGAAAATLRVIGIR